MYRPLSPCPGCHRHIVATEPACPFCSRVLATALPARPDTSRRLSRAAAFSFAASLTAAGCSNSVSATDAAPNVDVGPTDAPVDRPTTDTATTDNGATDTGAVDTGSVDTGVLDIGNVAPPYGAGAPDDDGGAMDLYGAPPFDGG
jgi:hypothetical protein